MPRFRYTATNAQGKTVRGVTDAPSEEALYTKLRGDGLYMTDAQEAQKSHSAFRPLKTAMLADFCRNLGTLLAAGVPADCTAMQAIGYKEFFPYFEGTAPLEECTEKLKQATRNYAKRQLTWFRRQNEAVWLYLDEEDVTARACALVREFLQN